jgi:hypothetical protein
MGIGVLFKEGFKPNHSCHLLIKSTFIGFVCFVCFSFQFMKPATKKKKNFRFRDPFNGHVPSLVLLCSFSKGPHVLQHPEQLAPQPKSTRKKKKNKQKREKRKTKAVLSAKWPCNSTKSSTMCPF